MNHPDPTKPHQRVARLKEDGQNNPAMSDVFATVHNTEDQFVKLTTESGSAQWFYQIGTEIRRGRKIITLDSASWERNVAKQVQLYDRDDHCWLRVRREHMDRPFTHITYTLERVLRAEVEPL